MMEVILDTPCMMYKSPNLSKSQEHALTYAETCFSRSRFLTSEQLKQVYRCNKLCKYFEQFF